jgi:hypothetical protein
MAGTIEGGRKASEDGRGNPDKASPATIEKYLKGIHYPAQKEDLINQAENNGAPQDAMNVLNRFEDKEYDSTVDVAKEVSKAE